MSGWGRRSSPSEKDECVLRGSAMGCLKKRKRKVRRLGKETKEIELTDVQEAENEKDPC